MKLSKQVIYAIGISVLFLMLHIFILYFHFTEVLSLVMIMGAMILSQLLAFRLLQLEYKNRALTFKAIFYMLCMTQTFSILLLTFQAAFDPATKSKSLNPAEILTSLMIFAVVMPLIITSAIWISTSQKRG
ncbi:MAG TPA: hypothetical protein VGC65_05560 [Bacteroidia bacterium]|jgi:hypothetical protein